MALTNEYRPYPSTSVSAFGRLFCGVDNRVLFSQLLVDDINVLGRCYQSNDPTSTDISDILPTDGGEIPLQNAGNIIKLVEFRSGVVAFCEKGTWYITGTEGGFTADNYYVNKVSEDTIYSINSLTVVGDVCFFASEDGILALQANEYNNLSITNLTESTINTFFNKLVGYYMRSIYEPIKKQIWYINTSTGLALIHDLRTNAFYPQKFELSDNEYVVAVYRVPRDPYIKFVYEDTQSQEYNILELKDSTFEDIGNPYESYLVTAEESLGQFTHSKDVRNFYAIFNKTETEITGFDGTDYTYNLPSACHMRAEFDYAQSADAGTYTQERQIYKVNRRGFIPPSGFPAPFDDGRRVVEFRDILRGNGKSVRFRFRSEPNKDMQIMGYSVEYSMRGRQ